MSFHEVTFVIYKKLTVQKKLKRGKKKFEIACYKNTVQAFRAGNETDLDNVLQIPNVFVNVSKGQVAPNDDLKKSFPGMSRDEVVLEILNKGELQVGEKERAHELDRVHKEVMDIVAGRLVDPKSKRVYTTGMIEKALDQLSSQGAQGRLAGKVLSEHGSRSQSRDPSTATDSGANTTQAQANGDVSSGSAKPAESTKPKWTGVTTNKSAKAQALEAMKALIEYQPIPVARARMKLRITCPNGILKQSVKSAPKSEGEESQTGSVKDKLLSFVEKVESQEVAGEEWECEGFVEPGNFKTLSEFVNTQTKGKARVEVIDQAVVHEGD